MVAMIDWHEVRVMEDLPKQTDHYLVNIYYPEGIFSSIFDSNEHNFIDILYFDVTQKIWIPMVGCEAINGITDFVDQNVPHSRIVTHWAERPVSPNKNHD